MSGIIFANTGIEEEMELLKISFSPTIQTEMAENNKGTQTD